MKIKFNKDAWYNDELIAVKGEIKEYSNDFCGRWIKRGMAEEVFIVEVEAKKVEEVVKKVEQELKIVEEQEIVVETKKKESSKKGK